MKRFKKLLPPILAAALFLSGCGADREQSTNFNSAGKTLYATAIQYSGEDESVEAYLEIAQRSQKLFPLLEENLGAFVMNAYNYQDIDGKGTPLYEENRLNYPVEIDPAGWTVQVSKNYFLLHPVKTTEGKPVEELLKLGENTMNLLVPESCRAQEAELLSAWREHFYFEKVEAENSYNQQAGKTERLKLSLEDLEIHIIYVQDGQRYFTYREDCAVETGGWITDPVVEIYTSNIHCNYAHSNLSQWTYFAADTENAQEAFAEMLPFVQECSAEQCFQKVEPVEVLP